MLLIPYISNIPSLISQLIPCICLCALMLHKYVICFLARAPAGGPSLPRNYTRVLPYSNITIFPDAIDPLVVYK